MPRPDYPESDDTRWHMHFYKRQRPRWWPENESWPPERRHWRRIGNHYPFFRRLGCLFAGFSLLAFVIFLSVVVLVINGLGIIHIPIVFFQGLIPIAGIFLGLMIVMIVFAATNLRRISVPLDDLLVAANKVAEGDYSTRVEEKGPPEVLSLTRAFNSMAKRLQVNDEQRRALLADVSHELRTPLTVIQGNLEGVLDGMYQADDRKMRSMLEETRLLSRLVDDLKTLSLAESGVLKLTREQTNLTSLVREVVDGYQAQADNAGVRIDLPLIDSDLTSEVDPERIQQVLSNLISNALRYTSRNGLVRIGLAKNPMIQDKCIQISVSDNGPGIASEDLPHIFERYYKSGDSHGMGLGLSIAKYIIEAHGGEIKATSEAGKGTTISFSLPC